MAKIMLSAGEASGDTHGASIARAILAQAPETELIGFGGKLMRAQGVRLAADMADYSVMVWLRCCSICARFSACWIC